MYGWRARIGLVLPMDNAVMEPELGQAAVDGVCYYAARLTTNLREQMPQCGVDISSTFVEMGADLIVYACAETSFLQGVDGNTWIRQEIERRTALPAITASAAMVEAIASLGADRIALVTPYTAGRAEIMRDFLGRHAISVVGEASRDFNAGTGEPREWLHTNKQMPSVAYAMARAADTPEAQAVVISATNFRTLEIIPALEADLGKPVVTTNQAIVWAALRRLGIKVSLPHLGQLLQTV